MSKNDNVTHYIDNDRFYKLIVERQEQLKTQPDLPISDEIGEILYNLAHNLTFHKKFMKPMYEGFRDDMISDALENNIKYFDKFNPETTKNPFSYWTQATWCTFLRRIDKEMKELNDKDKLKLLEATNDSSYDVNESDIYESFDVIPEIMHDNNYFDCPLYNDNEVKK